MAWESLAGAALVGAASAPAAGIPAAAQNEAHAEEIVVTAQRSGVPIWRVKSDTTTVVLVGALKGVPREVRWNPAALTEAMRRADRVMFPQMQSVSASAFAYPGLLLRWRQHRSLPAGQGLSTILAPSQQARLVALQRRGLVEANYERRHPLHFGLQLRGKMFGREGRDVYDEARRAISKYKLHLVPISRGKLKPFADELFGSSPRSHVPCLISAIDLAEAGPTAVRARADAWLARRPRQAIDNAAERAQNGCWPSDPSEIAAGDAEYAARLSEILREPQVTLAVMSLRSLVRPGGILDTLERAGFEISGPDWRR